MIKFYKHYLILFYKYIQLIVRCFVTYLGFVVCLEFCRSITLVSQGLFRCVLHYEDDRPDDEREGDLQQRPRSKFS